MPPPPPPRPRPARRRHRILSRLIGYTLCFAFIGSNVLAYFHSRAMLTFAEGGNRTPSPERLDWRQKADVLIRGVQLPKPRNNRTPKDFDLPFETRTLSGAFGLRLEGWLIPSTESCGIVFLFHGHSASKDSLLPAAKTFHELGWDCFLLDFHGSGGSAGTSTSVGWHEAMDVAEAYNHVGVDYWDKPAVLYGVSMGAAAALRAVAEHGIQPDGIILEQPFDTMLNTVRQRFKAMELPATPFAELLVLYGGLHRGFNGFEHNPADYARAVSCPALILNGENDQRATPSQAQRVLRNLGGPKVRRQFAGLGHVAFVESRPEEWRTVVSEILIRTSEHFESRKSN